MSDATDFVPFVGDPIAQLDALRADYRIVESEAMYGARLLLTYDGCRQVLTDDAVYSSAFALGGPLEANNPEVVMRTLPGFMRLPGLTPVVDVDLPRHEELRRTLHRAWDPRWINGLRPEFRRIAEEQASSLPRNAEVDLVADYTTPYVQQVMARLMGIPGDMVDAVAGWAADVETVISPPAARTPEAKLEAARRLVDYEKWAAPFVDQVRDERDVISVYAHGSADVPPLGRENTMYALLVHWVAGTVTTRHAIGTAVDLLLRHRDRYPEAFLAPDEHAPTVIHEALRYAAPHRGLVRVTTREVELEGETLPPGTMVLPMLQSAGRDSAHYEDASEYRPTRDRVNDHLAFGLGRHRCIGAHTGLAEGAEAVSALLRLRPEIRLVNAEKPTPIQPDYFFHGPASLLVTP